MNKTLDKIIRFFRFKVLFDNLPKKINKILDIGCGSNPWFFNFNKDRLINTKIVGIDSESINFLSAPDNFNFIKVDIDKKLSFGNEQFDFITAIAFIEHLNNPEEIIREVYRILKPNGIFIITTPSKFAKPILEFLAFKLHLIDAKSISDHKRYFSKKELKEILLKNQFTIEKLNYFELGLNLFVKVKKA